MSIQNLKRVFEQLTYCKTWSLQLIQIKTSSKSGINYFCREIKLEPEDDLHKAVKDIGDFYCSNKGIESYLSVDQYKGDLVGHVIYKLSKENGWISNDYEKLMHSIASPDKEIKINELKPNALVFKGTVTVENRTISCLLFSVQKPVSTLSNKFLFTEGNEFRKIYAPVLTLKKTIDAAIIGSTVYLFSLAGENLFNLERTYKLFCNAVVNEIAKCTFLTDPVSFSDKASSGRNPRRFVSYNNEHFEWLKKEANRREAAEKFGLSLEGNRIKTTDEESVERLVKFLCDKAMVDPCDKSAKEVAAAKPWR